MFKMSASFSELIIPVNLAYVCSGVAANTIEDYVNQMEGSKRVLSFIHPCNSVIVFPLMTLLSGKTCQIMFILFPLLPPSLINSNHIPLL